MDQQSSLNYNPDSLTVLNFASPLLPVKDYSTVVTNFPWINCFEPYGTRGDFFLSFDFYKNGKFVGEMSSAHCDETGCIQLNFDDFVQFHDTFETGLIITRFHHTKTIPPELYISHIHRESGAYMAYPANNFMGDDIYIDQQYKILQNTLFWPGVLNNDKVEESLIICNPFKISYSYQISLFLQNLKREQCAIKKIKPYSVEVFRLEELFPGCKEMMAENGTQCSLCIAGQYKLVAYVMFKQRSSGIITTIDHLHTYQIY